jgi:hypothetical protein
MLPRLRIHLILWLGVILLVSTPAVSRSELATYKFQLEAYDQGRLVKKEPFETVAESD